LAEHRLAELAHAVVHAGIAWRLQFTAPALDLLDELYELVGADATALSLLTTAQGSLPPLVDFAPTRADAVRAVGEVAAEIRTMLPPAGRSLGR